MYVRTYVCMFADYLTVPCGIHVSVYCVYIHVYMCISMMHVCILCACLHVRVCACVTVSERTCTCVHTYVCPYLAAYVDFHAWNTPEISVLAVSLCSVVASAVTLGRWIRGQVSHSTEQCRYD